MTQSFQSKPSSETAEVADSGTIILGAGLRLPTALAHVAGYGKISCGADLRLLGERKTA